MVRRSDPSGCVFCDPDPCGCKQKTKPPRTPRKLTVAEPEDAVIPAAPLRPSVLDKIRQAAARDELDRKKKELMIAPPLQHISEHDAVMLQAIRNLSAVFEVDGPGLEPYKTQLAREPSVTERALAWKARRREDA